MIISALLVTSVASLSDECDPALATSFGLCFIISYGELWLYYLHCLSFSGQFRCGKGIPDVTKLLRARFAGSFWARETECGLLR